jgi:hypothetical protein
VDCRLIDSKWIWCVVVLFSPGLASPAAQLHVPVADSERVQEHLTELARFGAKPGGGVSRVAYSDADIAGRAYVKGLMEAAGLDVRISVHHLREALHRRLRRAH